MALLAFGCFAEFLWDSQTAGTYLRHPGTGLFAGIRVIAVGQPCVGRRCLPYILLKKIGSELFEETMFFLDITCFFY